MDACDAGLGWRLGRWRYLGLAVLIPVGYCLVIYAWLTAPGAVAIVVALMLQLLFRTKHMPFGAHLIFALHYISFMYLLTIAAGASRTIGLSTDATASAGYVLLLPYLILGRERVYSESIGVILLKAAALLLLTVALNSLANFAAIRLTLALV